jgi:hypothetical protein
VCQKFTLDGQRARDEAYAGRPAQGRHIDSRQTGIARKISFRKGLSAEECDPTIIKVTTTRRPGFLFETVHITRSLRAGSEERKRDPPDSNTNYQRH